MTPSVSSKTKKPGSKNHQVQVQAKVPTRFTQSTVNKDERVLQFREARKAKEAERMDKLRNARLKSSSAAASAMSASLSITSIASSSGCPTRKPAGSSLLKNHSAAASTTGCASVSNVNIGPTTSCPPLQGVSGVCLSKSKALNSTCKLSPLPLKPGHSHQSSMKHLQTSSTTEFKPTTKRLPASQQPTKSSSGKIKTRRSNIGRLSISRKTEFKTSFKKPIRKAPKAEVKMTRTAQLRILKSDPLFNVSQFTMDASQRVVLPLPATFSKQVETTKNIPMDYLDKEKTFKCQGSLGDKRVQNKEHVEKKPALDSCLKGKVCHISESPSKIPRKKTSFVSPLRKAVPLTPKPSPLRARLEEWLEKNDHSFDNFKHLKCFGVLGPAVKRPQTPFRKVQMSSTTLRAIPESSELTSSKEKIEETSDDDNVGLNSTFTLEDEDKENIFSSLDALPQISNPNAGKILSPNTLRIKELDQAQGVLSELHRLIKMAYPTEQCEQWLKAIRRRFPQCGDEPIYWECLASLEETRGDFQSAVACYERAILQGAQESVQSSLNHLLQKMSDLHIEPIPSIKKSEKRMASNLALTSNIIKSSSIQFAVQEKHNSSRKNAIDEKEDEDDSVFTATPVRRSMRLAGTPAKGTPGMTCVRSLEFLEPKVKNSLIFHGNSALDPRD
ncbi:Cytoskeleton-associated protein 2 [Frankliniella fusca]|uniref:Cytoskeleton-associated protein 2 n=1 Tax=Frankliniella fusca TaxID=407009 RepID=A0AAE1LAU0_9NEOP|nr:Cytoskeleton-associated protein 2 [Frankliniella fusca]